MKVFPVSHVIAAHRPRAIKKEDEFLLDAREGQRGAEARPQVKVPSGEWAYLISKMVIWDLGIKFVFKYLHFEAKNPHF